MTAPAHNTVAWFQIGSDDPDTAKKFYGELFGWSFGADPQFGGSYDLVSYAGSDRPAGGLSHTPDADGNHAIFFVLVADVAASVAAAQRLGATVRVPVTTSPDGLVFAELIDNSGNHFGVFTPA